MDQRAGLPDGATLSAFLLIVLIGGLNFVGVRFSNRELPPFYGAGGRFLAAAILLFAFIALRRVPLPRGKSLLGTVLYGVLSFTGAYAFAYWALKELSSGIAAVIMASVPLLTLFFAMIHGVERFKLRGLLGAILAVGGIGVLVASGGTSDVAFGSLLAMLGAAVCAAESGVVLKRFPPSHPVATNAVAMLIGALLLLALSAIANERWILPQAQATWVSFGYLVAVGSVGLFGLYLFTLKNWTASGVSYMFVLFPIVASIAGAILAREVITTSTVVGGAIVLGGVYIGALSTARSKEAPAATPEGCPPVEEAVA